MIYELVTTETGEQALKATDSSGKVWWIPQESGNSKYEEYLSQ
jgi:hypothetical protein